jgi:hypothetical protein
MRLGGGSSSTGRDATILGVETEGCVVSGAAATTGDASRSIGSSDASGLAETVKRQRQCDAAARRCPVLGARCPVRSGPGLAGWQHDICPRGALGGCAPGIWRPAPGAISSQREAGAVPAGTVRGPQSQATGCRSGGQQQ